MKIGDIVKSLDFNGIDNCYMVGKVVRINEMGTFRAILIKRVWEGVDEELEVKPDYFTAPQQGQHMFDNAATPRVSVLA